MRLIDADELMELYSLGEDLEEHTELLSVPIAVIRQNIKDIPTIDAFPVVRCKDCLCYEEGWCCHPRNNGFHDVLLMNEEDFCSCGEKRDE